MGATHGIAGVAGVSLSPEVEGIFLLDSEDEIAWFAQMGLEQGHETMDVWQVSLPEDVELHGSDEGYQYVSAPITPDAIRLHIKDWVERDPSNVAGDLFHEIFYGEGGIDPTLLTEKVVVKDIDGNRTQGAHAVMEWAVRRAHGSPSPPEPGPDGNVVFELGGEGGFTIEGLDDDRRLISPSTDRDFWTVVRVQNNRVAEIHEYRTRGEAFRGALGEDES
jgi:hypothetical protein